MRLLFSTALKGRKQFLSLFVILIAMGCLTFASQLEIFAIGVLTKKGPDFFEIFGEVKEGKIVKREAVTKDQLDTRWQEIDDVGKGEISQADATRYLARWKRDDRFEMAIAWLDSKLHVIGNLTNLAFFLIFVAIFKAVSLFCHRYATRLTAIRVSRNLRQDYFEHIQSLPLEFYQKHQIGNLSSRVVIDAMLIAEAVNASLVNYFQTPFTVVSTLFLCFLLSWKLSLIIFFGFPLLIFPIIFMARRIRRISRQIQKNQEAFASVLIEFLSGIQTVKVFAMEEFSLKKYREQNDKMAALDRKVARYDVSARPIIHTIGMFFLVTTMLYGLYGLRMSVSEVLVYCGFLWIFYEPIKKFADENALIQRGIAAAERMTEVMSLKPDIRDEEGSVDLTNFHESIEFDDVWFRYEDEWVLKGVSFTIKKGESIAIVGPTGSGKSTIVQLLPRLYEPEQGEIRIDGKSLRGYTQNSLRENIAFVPQKPFLFLDTVSENIAFGRPFSKDEIREAAKKAHADEFIEELPQGYDSELAEAGKNLSGGQQQRLAIARALVKKAPILVMDEATSSLDALSEHHIKTAIEQLRGSVTQIIIAHRLSTIEHVDRIIYIERGEKIAEGNKEELLKSCPPFKRMWEMMYHQMAV